MNNLPSLQQGAGHISSMSNRRAAGRSLLSAPSRSLLAVDQSDPWATNIGNCDGGCDEHPWVPFKVYTRSCGDSCDSCSCRLGSYNANAGCTECSTAACPVDQYRQQCQEGATTNSVCVSCTTSACPAGQYREMCLEGLATADAVCVPCTNAPDCSGSSTPPTYTSSGSPVHSNNCAWEAPSGFRGARPNVYAKDTCSICSLGTFSAASGLGECSQRVSGTYQAEKGSVVCNACPANSHSPVQSTASTACTCNVGWTGPNGGGTCTKCVAGKYKIATGDAACASCLVGKYSTLVGATSNVCQACPTNSNAPAGATSR